MSKVPHLLKGSALPDGEQRRLAEYASVHPKSALHRKGQHHDAAVLLVHGIGYQNHGETLAYFGKPVAHSVQTLLALNTDSVALSEENPAAEDSARVRVEVIPDGDTLPLAAEVNPLSHHSELTYSLTIERTEYPADPVEHGAAGCERIGCLEGSGSYCPQGCPGKSLREHPGGCAPGQPVRHARLREVADSVAFRARRFHAVRGVHAAAGAVAC